MFILAIAFGLMLWGCSSQTQDPVSSVNSVGNGGPQILHMTIGTPTNVLAVVSGQTVTISWDAVAGANSYHVVITSNGDTSLSVVQAATQLVVPNLQYGSYSVTVAANVPGYAEGDASTPVLFTVSSVVAPTVTVTATPISFCKRDGEWVTVKFSGVVTNSQGGASYELIDEYKQIHYTGTVTAGPYSVSLKLKDRRFGFDRDGRQYTFTITATNSAGTATASVVVTVPVERGFHAWDDDDYSDNWGWRH